MRNKAQEIIALSGGEFSALVLLSGVFSPIMFVISWIWEVLEKWL